MGHHFFRNTLPFSRCRDPRIPCHVVVVLDSKATHTHATMHNEPPSDMEYKKVRLKRDPHRKTLSVVSSHPYQVIQIIILTTLVGFVSSNRPPRFAIDGHSEIVLRLKESPETKVGKLEDALVCFTLRISLVTPFFLSHSRNPDLYVKRL